MHNILKSEVTKQTEVLGWKVTETGGGLEFENWSPAGENLIVTANGNNPGADVTAYAESYDPEEHALELGPNRGKNGVPGTLECILEDSFKVAEMLDKLAEAVRAAEETAAERLAEQKEEAQRACPMPGDKDGSGAARKPRKRGRPKKKTKATLDDNTGAGKSYNKPDRPQKKNNGRASRNKGKAGEREISKALRDLGFAGVRRGQQYSGSEISADIAGLPHIHPEVKRTEQFRLWAALDQATADSGSSENMPAVFHRKNRRPWVCIMRLEDWGRIYSSYLRELERETGGEK